MTKRKPEPARNLNSDQLQYVQVSIVRSTKYWYIAQSVSRVTGACYSFPVRQPTPRVAMSGRLHAAALKREHCELKESWFSWEMVAETGEESTGGRES